MDIDLHDSSPNLAANPANLYFRTDEIIQHGGIHINGRPAELVRIKKNGKKISMATGEPIETSLMKRTTGPSCSKRPPARKLEDEE